MSGLASLPVVLLCTELRGIWGATLLFDFEDVAEVRCWHDEGKATLGGDKSLEQARRFAASGAYSLRFSTGAWRPEEHGGRDIWPAFECQPPITDWSKFDRLAMTLVNATPAVQKVMLFISDSKHPTRSGVLSRTVLPPWGYAQELIDLRGEFARQGLDPADVRVMHFFTESPPVDMTVYIDRLLLLEPGEPVPPLPASFLQEFAVLQADALDDCAALLQQAAGRIGQASSGFPALQAWASAEVHRLQARLGALRQVAARADEQVLGLPQ
jgi:hypothetical protein